MKPLKWKRSLLASLPLTPRAVAKRLKVSLAAVYRLTLGPELDAYVGPGGRLRIPLASVEKYEARR